MPSRTIANFGVLSFAPAKALAAKSSKIRAPSGLSSNTVARHHIKKPMNCLSCGRHLVAVHAELVGEDDEQVGVVVHDQDPRRRLAVRSGAAVHGRRISARISGSGAGGGSGRRVPIGVAGAQLEAPRPRAPGGGDLRRASPARPRTTSRPSRTPVVREAVREPLAATSTAGARRSRVGRRERGPRPGRRARRARRCRGRRLVEGQRAAQQRAPRQLDDDAVGDARELRRQVPRPRRRRTGAFGQAAASRRSRRHDADASAMASALASMPMTSVVGFGGRGGQHEPAIAGAEVDHDPGRAGAPSWRVSRRPPRGRACRSRCACRDPTRWPRTRNGPAAACARERSPTLRRDVRAPDPPVRAPAGGVPPVGPDDPRTSRATSPGWSSPRGPARTPSTSAARRCRGCRARTWSTSASRPTPTTSRTSSTRCSRSGSSARAASRRSRRPGPLMLGNVDHDGTSYPRPPPRHAAGAPRARRAARVPRRAARRPRAARRVRGVEAGVRRGGARRRRQPAVHGPQGRLRPGRAVPPRHPPAAGRRARARSRPARRSGSWAAGSWAGCSGSRPARWATGSSPSTPTRPARPRRSPTRSSSAPTTTSDAARRLAADVGRRHLRAGARRARRGRRGRGDCAAPPRARVAPGDARPARRAPLHPRDRGVGGAVARGPRRRRRPRRRRCPRLPRPPQDARSAGTTAAARPGSRRRRRSRPP